ncbi:hypothetical protein AZI86_05705 [Bdellovibrio bacteriovorus]|uniref:DNA-binding response regulator n=2 Tax=Bdellovibrio bacteriovorus TaxID=959 RepID=A0A150WQG4_BDEBC|nr:hypothetical protein AZI86_05705 [Bdellovibrio bacteriovorus]
MRLLLEDSYDVSCATDGLNGLKNALRNPPDLILMDLKMPNMDGFETCRLLRADSEFSDISIIVVSGFVSDQDRVRALQAGADDFISKPFETKELLHRIAKRLSEKNTSKSQEQLLRRGIFKYKSLRLDAVELKAFVNDEPVHFSQVEFGILKILVEGAETVIPREVFISSLWPGQEVSSRIMDAHLVSIRNKLKGQDLQISSVYGKGYILKSS